MAESNATILIPDISGFTEFMTTTELSHATHAINNLIEVMIKAVGDEYEISEIEGDAVLMIRRGPAPSKKQILDTCLKIFNAFHLQRKWMQQYTICPCGACQAIINLTVKFIAHHGPVSEMKIGRFTTHSGPEMIVAHRLLKNNIGNNEYVLMTEKLLSAADDDSAHVQMKWQQSSEEYPSIGKVDYHFALLNDVRKNIPDPPKKQNNYHIDNTTHFELSIAANYFDVYMLIMNIDDRPAWVPELQKIEQDVPGTFVGSLHYFTYKDYKASVSPLKMMAGNEGIMYVETAAIESTDISVVYEYVFKKTSEGNCNFSCRLMNNGASPIEEEIFSRLLGDMTQMANKLKEAAEKGAGSA